MVEPRVYTERQVIDAAKDLGPTAREAVMHVLAKLAMTRLEAEQKPVEA